MTFSLLQSILMFFWWLPVGTDQSGRGAPLIGSARRLSGNGRKSLLLLAPGAVSSAASILTPLSSLPPAQRHAWTLQRCCRILIYLHYAAVHMIHFSFNAVNNFHSNHTGVAYEAAGLGGVCVCVNRNSVCVFVHPLVSPLQAVSLPWDSPESFHRGRLWWIYMCVRSAPHCWCWTGVTVSARMFACLTHRKTAWHEKKKLFVCPSTKIQKQWKERKERGSKRIREMRGEWGYYTSVKRQIQT